MNRFALFKLIILMFILSACYLPLAEAGPPIKGMGLGLSIVRRLVADYDGSVRVSSQVGRGTRFEVEFPAAEPERMNGSSGMKTPEKATYEPGSGR